MKICFIVALWRAQGEREREQDEYFFLIEFPQNLWILFLNLFQ